MPPIKEISLPCDLEQVPDIFIDFYTDTTFSSDVRFAYLRLKVTDHLSSHAKPNWHRLSSPYNDTGDSKLGMVMTNVQFLKYDKEADATYADKRQVKEKSGKTKYKFYGQIISGFELASCFPEGEL